VTEMSRSIVKCYIPTMWLSANSRVRWYTC